MPGLPAARMMDMHTCPICMGAPMPITSPCAPTVLIGKMPAARLTDMCACANPTGLDAIVFGSPTVLICGLPAARMTDFTVLGGTILPPCCPTVLIGMVGVAVPGMPGMGNVWNETLPDGTVVTHVGENITIAGSQSFREATLRDLQKLAATPTGADLINTLNGPGRGPVTIVETTGGNSVDGVGPQGYQQADGSNGTGSGSTLHYNPNRTQIGDGSEAWMTRPPEVGLGHELVHCEQAQDGTWSDTNMHGGVLDDELAAAGLPPFEDNPHTENRIRREMGQPNRPRY
jgi:uncharacterized Zn-binding protein involved in type VI secretion